MLQVILCTLYPPQKVGVIKLERMVHHPVFAAFIAVKSAICQLRHHWLPLPKKMIGYPSSMETIYVEGHMRTHYSRSCDDMTILTPSPSDATIPKATKIPSLL